MATVGTVPKTPLCSANCQWLCGGGDDRNDADADINPGADEVCDGLDNDCDGYADPASAIDATTGTRRG